MHRTVLCLISIMLLSLSPVYAQQVPYYQWTLLPEKYMAEIIGEASGETAYNTIMETGGYNKDRLDDEYYGTFYEAQYIYDKLKEYNLPGADLVRLPAGREVWDGVEGELWEIEPGRRKIASYRDMTAMLASGSNNADVKAELIWVGRGTRDELKNLDVKGKIVVTDASASSVHRIACQEMGAEGVISMYNSRPSFDPMQIPLSGIRSRRGGSGGVVKFAFYLPPREGDFLKNRLLDGQKIVAHAKVKSRMMKYDYQDPVCMIPGTDPDAQEIIFSAHLFEGYVKQGANDNKSGSASILEVARVLNTLIKEGRIPPPKRTIRFLWGPEYSGTGPWTVANPEIMARTLCNINMDMVGEWLSKNQAYFCLMRTTFGNPHYINDVMENYFRYVGESNRERIQNRRYFNKVPNRIVAPTGSDEPFYYSIETHYGASDHQVFNNWGLQVPGIMMIAWPDRWYHTSGDRIDKSDPTQLKRTVIIGAAAAYTIANADDNQAIKIAGETLSNGARRLGHQLVLGMEALNNATSENLTVAYKSAVYLLDAAGINESQTLESIIELAADKKFVGDYIKNAVKTIRADVKSKSKALEMHMIAAAARLNTEKVKIKLTDLEKRAGKIIPRQTEKVKANGYGGFSDALDEVSESDRAKYPTGNVSSISELQLLINGKNSVLDIKKMLDAQYVDKSDIEHILNHLEILKLAGLIEM